MVEGAEHGENGSERDDLADRLIEKRERLAYFVITGATAVVAFTIASLGRAVAAIGACGKAALVVGGVLLLLAAGLALYSIFWRHRVYANYLDQLGGRRPKLEPAQEQALRDRFGRLEAWTMILFYVGVVLLAIVNTVAIF